MPKPEIYPIAEAKKPNKLAEAHEDAKKHAEKAGFGRVKDIDEDLVATAMTATKKPADFVYEIAFKGEACMLDLVCEVAPKKADGGRWVMGRRQIADSEDYRKAKGLAGIAALDKHFG